MRLTVLKELKYDGRRHAPGSVLKDVPITTGRRFVASGLAAIVADPEPAPPALTSEPAGDDPVAIDDMTVAQLRALGAEWGITLPSKANRAQLITDLKAHEANRDTSAGETSGESGAVDGDENPTGDGDDSNDDEPSTGENAGDAGTQE